PPRRPERPIRPNRRMIDLGGAAGGLAFGVVISLLLQLWERTLKEEAEVPIVLGLPALPFIPLLPPPSSRRPTPGRPAAVGPRLVTIFGISIAAIWLNFRM